MTTEAGRQPEHPGTQTAGRIQKVDPPIWDPLLLRDLIGTLIKGSTVWIPWGVWAPSQRCLCLTRHGGDGDDEASGDAAASAAAAADEDDDDDDDDDDGDCDGSC